MTKKEGKKELVVTPKKTTEIVQQDPYQMQQASVEKMITQAIQSGVPVDTMERVLAMRKELKAEYAKEQFDKAMAQFQADMPEIKKTKEVKDKNGKLLYAYAPIDSIVSQVKGILAKNGLSYTIKTEMGEGKVKSICIIKHTAGHSEQSEMEVPLGNKTDIMSNSQVTAAASTFSKRYAFMNALGIMTAEDDKEENLKEIEADQSQIDKAIGALDKCMTKEALLKTWNTFSKEVRANKEVIIHANQIKSNIENENSQNGSAE